MSYHVEIDLHDLDVLIIGAGKVALRKCKKCLEEGARVAVFAKVYDEGFDALDVLKLSGEYHHELLDDYVFIILASDDPSFQKQVAADARMQHRLCMGVHQHDEAVLHPMVSADREYFQLAVSTKGHFPAMSRVLVDEACNYLEHKEHDRLALLSKLRKEIKIQCRRDMRHTLCQCLVNAHFDILQDVRAVLEKKVIHVFCFHGVKDEKVLQDIRAFCVETEKKYQGAAVCSAYLSRPVCDVINTAQLCVWQLDELMNILNALFDKTIILHPMLFQDGRYHEQIKKYADIPSVQIAPLPFVNEQEVKELFACIRNHHRDVDMILVRYHSSRHGLFASYIQNLQKEYDDMLFSFEKDDPSKLCVQGRRLLIYPLYMLKGLHMRHDEEVLVEYFTRQGMQVSCMNDSVICCEELCELLLSKL